MLGTEPERSSGTDEIPTFARRLSRCPPVGAGAGDRRGWEGGPAMPMYEFECADCSKSFDAKETFEEHDRHKEIRCPYCGGTNVHQHVTPVGVKTTKKS
jgi:putative FmdB family regulatory protein